MNLRQIEDGAVTVELNPDDCAVLAAACELASITVDGSGPTEATLARLHLSEHSATPLSALASAFAAAWVASHALAEMPTATAASCTLTARRGRGPTWHGSPPPDTGEDTNTSN